MCFLPFLASAHSLKEYLEPSENWDDDFEFGQGNGRPSTSSRMCERRAGTMSQRWRLNATTWMLNSRRIRLSLLGRGVLRFLSLPLRLLRRHFLRRSSLLITNTRRLNLVLQRPTCFPSQMPPIPIRHRPLLFTVPIRV